MVPGTARSQVSCFALHHLEIAFPAKVRSHSTSSHLFAYQRKLVRPSHERHTCVWHIISWMRSCDGSIAPRVGASRYGVLLIVSVRPFRLKPITHSIVEEER